MSREQVLEAVLAHVADQRCTDAAALMGPPRSDDDVFTLSLRSFLAFMVSDHAAATRWARAARSTASAGPVDELLAAAVLAYAAAADPDLDDRAVCAALPELAGFVDPSDPVSAFARYVAVEAALASARLSLAAALQETGPPAHEVWSDHPYATVMLACHARLLAFTGEIRRALSVLEVAADDSPAGLLLRATHALVAGNAADLSTMRSLVAEVEAAQVPPVDRIGRGVHLLLAFGEIALGDVNSSVEHLLRAGGGARLEHLMIVDRALGHELLITQAVAEADLESARAWQQLAEEQATHRGAAPTVLRCRARIATLLGDHAAAQRAAAEAVELARREGRLVEAAEGEIVLARTRLAAADDVGATRGLRDAVAQGDRRGHLAVRESAARVLRPTRRRLPPISGGGRTSLSPRERDVADLVASGASNAAIAAQLHLSEATVRTHMTRILTAHGVATRTGLLALLHEMPIEPRRPDELTPRQCDVVALVALGKGNHDIAVDLGISLKSVETHLASIRVRWQVSSRFDVALRWWELQQDATA